MKKKGSSLLLIVMIIAVVTLVALNALQSSTYSLDLSLQRLESTHKQMALEGVLSYAIAMVENKSLRPIIDWPIGQRIAQANIAVEYSTAGYVLSAILQQENVTVGSASCTVHTDSNTLHVTNWHIKIV